ncbi:hypothetical protein DID78_02090 [Candidatus Marinamargulisbacteria bacterium SCGC AG-343-D04]|nr:hypothetical protein DID78_02090 [Candidatus Marinamargulisbacteria bacterium SCGC AG-343-D04]
MPEKRRRSVVKAISWRVTASVTTMVISYFITGSLDIAFKIGIIESAMKIYLFYLHERIWAKLKFGLGKPMDYQI